MCGLTYASSATLCQTYQTMTDAIRALADAERNGECSSGAFRVMQEDTYFLITRRNRD